MVPCRDLSPTHKKHLPPSIVLAVGLTLLLVAPACAYIRYDPMKNYGLNWGVNFSSTSSEDYDLTVLGESDKGYKWDKTRYLSSVGYSFGGVVEPYLDFGLSQAKAESSFGDGTTYGGGLRITPSTAKWRFSFNFGYVTSIGHSIEQAYFLPGFGTIKLKLEMDETNIYVSNSVGYQAGWWLPYVGMAFVTTKVGGPFTVNGVAIADVEMNNPDKFSFVLGSMVTPSPNFGVDLGFRFSSEFEAHLGLVWSFGRQPVALADTK